MKMRPLLGVCLLTVMTTGTTLAAVPAEVQVTLARDGQPAATIVIAKKPTRAAQFAAYELQWHLKQITGGDFLIVDEATPIQGLPILVGDSQPVRAIGDPTRSVDEPGVPDPRHSRGAGAGGA